MNAFLKILGVLIVLSGFLFYMRQMVIDYNEGAEKAATSGTYENSQIKLAQASVLAAEGNTKDAIDLLLKTIEENPKDLEPQLKLAQLYTINCKKHNENCEDALWQLNVILKVDSTNVLAKQLMNELKLITNPPRKNQ